MNSFEIPFSRVGHHVFFITSVEKSRRKNRGRCQHRQHQHQLFYPTSRCTLQLRSLDDPALLLSALWLFSFYVLFRGSGSDSKASRYDSGGIQQTQNICPGDSNIPTTRDFCFDDLTDSVDGAQRGGSRMGWADGQMGGWVDGLQTLSLDCGGEDGLHAVFCSSSSRLVDFQVSGRVRMGTMK